MNHSFNIEVATKYGMFEAVLLENLNFWIEKNKANNVNFHDGYYWTYNSTKALSELFPYVSKNTISRALHHLKEDGLIVVGNYNKSPYDRTAWYALTEKAILLLNGSDNSQNEKSTDTEMDDSKIDDCISQNGEIEEPEMINGEIENHNSIYPKSKMEESKTINEFTQSQSPIPDINTDIETDINTGSNLTVSKDTVCQTDVCRVVEQWNSLANCGIKPIVKVSPETKRYDMLKARIRTYGVEKVLEAIEHIRGNSFLCGGNNRGWAITFDWFIRPNNFPKVLEGNYDRASSSTTENIVQQPVTSSGYSQELLDQLAGGYH